MIMTYITHDISDTASPAASTNGRALALHLLPIMSFVLRIVVFASSL